MRTRRTRRVTRSTTMAVAGALGLVCVACSDDEGADELVIVDEWTEPAGEGDDAIVNLIIVSPDDDAVVGAAVPSSVAESAALRASDGSAIESIVVPDDVAVFFRPENDHVVLEGLNRTLEDGDRFELTLEFEQAGERFVAVSVGDGPPFD